MSLLLASTMLPLFAVSADDARLERKRTYVSPAAEISLMKGGQDEVLCLDRRRYGSICLVRSEWAQAVKLANSAPKRGPKAFIPNNNRSPNSSSKYGLGSSPSTFRTR
uniref:hypothetical protein n=1 Tax=Parerythrobacter lutipelagi TaxID=1964208 RepID=UPI0010F80CC4|nr:hypothetical protein [Parerythrobacter lutipelagi]